MRDTNRKRAIIQLLEEHTETDYREYGTPPYSATTIAGEIDGSVQSVARTLRGMAEDGLLVSVRAKQPVWNSIAHGHIDMTVTAYWSARTMERDIARVKAWKDGAGKRSDIAASKLFGNA